MNTAKIITAFILSVMFIACGSTAESESKIIETQSSPVTAKELGVKTEYKFLLYFKLVKRIREASLEELEDAVNKRAAKAGYDYFSKGE